MRLSTLSSVLAASRVVATLPAWTTLPIKEVIRREAAGPTSTFTSVVVVTVTGGKHSHASHTEASHTEASHTETSPPSPPSPPSVAQTSYVAISSAVVHKNANGMYEPITLGSNQAATSTTPSSPTVHNRSAFAPITVSLNGETIVINIDGGSSTANSSQTSPPSVFATMTTDATAPSEASKSEPITTAASTENNTGPNPSPYTAPPSSTATSLPSSTPDAPPPPSSSSQSSTPPQSSSTASPPPPSVQTISSVVPLPSSSPPPPTSSPTSTPNPPSSTSQAPTTTAVSSTPPSTITSTPTPSTSAQPSDHPLPALAKNPSTDEAISTVFKPSATITTAEPVYMTKTISHPAADKTNAARDVGVIGVSQFNNHTVPGNETLKAMLEDAISSYRSAATITAAGMDSARESSASRKLKEGVVTFVKPDGTITAVPIATAEPDATFQASASRELDEAISSYKLSSSTAAKATNAARTEDVIQVSKDGRCGKGVTCEGSLFGNCCSERGYCVNGAGECGGGCWSVYGDFWGLECR